MKLPTLPLATRLFCLRCLQFIQARDDARTALQQARSLAQPQPGVITHGLAADLLKIARDSGRRARAAWEALCGC